MHCIKISHSATATLGKKGLESNIQPGVEYKHRISPCNKMNGVNHLQNCHAAKKQKMGGWKWPGKNSYPLSIPSTYVQNIPQLLWPVLLQNNWYTIYSTGIQDILLMASNFNVW